MALYLEVGLRTGSDFAGGRERLGLLHWVEARVVL